VTLRSIPTVLGTTCAAALLLAASAALAQGMTREPLSPRIAVKTGTVGALSDAGIFIAAEKGFFRDEGLDVELIGYKVGPQIIPSLATDQIQTSGTSVSPSLFNALHRGVGLRLVADKGQVSPGFGWAAIAVRSDLAATIRDYKDLRGRKIGLPAKAVSLYTQLGKALELGGLGPDDVDLVEIGFPDMMAALTNKAIDAAVLIEPFVALVTARKVAVRWKGVEDFYPFKAQNGVVLFGEKFTRQQPEAAKRWMIAYLKGVRAYRDAVSKGIERDTIYGILARNTDVRDATLYPKMQPIDFDLDGHVEVRSLDMDQDWFLKLGLQRERADLAKVIDYQYVDYAAAQLEKR
jgi:ABC-type nitrate/sulfonate/bicarbonate transport system substrate-binding protein